MALRKKYTLSKFSKDEFLGITTGQASIEMPSLQLENLFVVNMDFTEAKTSECQSRLVEPIKSLAPSPKIQLMKKVIVLMINNSL